MICYLTCHNYQILEYNSNTTFNGDANNNTTIYNQNYCIQEPMKVKHHDSPILVDQTVLVTEVIPNDKKIMELIWKYLKIEDKLNCGVVICVTIKRSI